MFLSSLVNHSLLRHNNSYNVTDTANISSEVLPVHRDSDDATDLTAILDLFWVCLYR